MFQGGAETATHTIPAGEASAAATTDAGGSKFAGCSVSWEGVPNGECAPRRRASSDQHSALQTPRDLFQVPRAVDVKPSCDVDHRSTSDLFFAS